MDDADALNVDFYDPEFYDRRIGLGARVGPLYLEQAQAHGGPILEAGCGTADVLLPIARAGIHAIGVDLSPRMVAHARRRLASEPADVRARLQIEQGELPDWTGRDFPRQVFLTNDFVSHLRDRAALARVFRAARALLVMQGRLVLDITTFDLAALARAVDPEATVARFRGRYDYGGGSAVAVWECPVYDPSNGILVTHFRYEMLAPNGTVERLVARTLVQHPWRADEIFFALQATGFEVETTAPRGGANEPAGLLIIARPCE